MTRQDRKHRIVIVGGGAGGLELATRLGHRLGKPGKAQILLVDATLTHLWKPLLHEVAAGTLDSQADRLDYLAQARRHHFGFRLGRMEGLDRTARRVHLTPVTDSGGEELLPGRSIRYDTLVLAVGSTGNDHGIPGVREHCFFLDSREQADRFHHILFHRFLRAQYGGESRPPGELKLAIIGGGATGVELAAELHHAARRMVDYGLDQVSPDRGFKITLVEGSSQILPALPHRLAEATERELLRIGVEVHKNTRVARVTEEGVSMQDGRFVPARLTVWAAGIKAPAFLRNLDGLESNSLDQVRVGVDLRTPRDPNIFALGDCASCPLGDTGGTVPPRAQAAHQQATTLAATLVQRLEGKPPVPYTYRDYGSLISLSRYTTVGSLMGNLTGDVMIEGRLARLVYRSLYRMHQRALYGFWRTCFIVLTDLITRPRRSRLKLH